MRNFLQTSVSQNIKTMRYLFFIFWIFSSPLLAAVRTDDQGTFPCPEYRFAWFDDDCDTCGCSGNGGSMGFGTGLDNNFVGIRYIGQQYRSRDGIFNNSLWIDEHFNTVQFWAKIPAGNRFAINALLPYHFHQREFADGTLQEISGVGDATLLGFYKVIKPLPDSIVPIKPVHDLQFGGGVKAPTGSFDQENLEGSVNPSFQVGTGSWDYVMAANYGLTYRNWGIMALVNYTIKTTNSTEYMFGNQLNYALNYYKTYYTGMFWSFTPQLGLGGEDFAKNESFGIPVSDTGGQVLFGRLGVEAKYQNIAFGVSGMLPITQNLNNGKVEVVNRVSLYFNFNI